MNYLEAVFAPAEARYRSVVLTETWGHLAPKPRRKYRGTVLFAVSCFGSGEVVVIDFDFGNLDSSPWFYEGLHDHLLTVASSDPGVYRFTGTYEFRTYKDWNRDDLHLFRGEVSAVPIPGFTMDNATSAGDES